MGSLFGRAIAVAGAMVVALGPAAGVAAAKPRPPVLAFSPAPYDYGQVAAGQSASRTFTLANTGGQATGKLALALTGPAAFTITGGTCHNLAPGKTCTVTVRFTPAHTGIVTATLTAASKKRHVTATDALTGTGGLGAAPGHLYWTDQIGTESGTIKVIPLTGAGTPATLVTEQASPAGVAVDAGHIYWGTVATQVVPAMLEEAPLTGGHPTALVHTGLTSPTGVAVDASHIYWSDSGSGTISKMLLTGGLITPLASSGKFALPAGVAVDSSHIYWANSGVGTINEAPLTGGRPTTLFSGQASPWGVAVDSGHIYWTNSGDGTIDEAPLTGGPVTTLVTGQDSPEGLAVDSGHLYWANNDLSGTINEAPLTGGPVTTLVTGQPSPVGVAVGP